MDTQPLGFEDLGARATHSDDFAGQHERLRRSFVSSAAMANRRQAANRRKPLPDRKITAIQHENRFELWTIGHSTRSLAEFVELLHAQEIAVLADVRRFPGSYAYPHFSAVALGASLPAAGIAYEPFPELGGRRRARRDSPNTAWRNTSFRGYADYMGTPEFEAGVARLTETARRARTAVMCSEAVWWRCHRSLLADCLKARGVTVIHIMAAGKTVIHPFTAPARLVNGGLSYRENEGVGARKG